MAEILLVEDESIVALDVKQRLHDLGHTVVGHASTAVEAFELALEQRPDLILMDISLRGPRDGIAAARDIQARMHVPIVFLTAYSDPENVARAKETSPYGYMLKPFQGRELAITLELALSKFEAERSIARARELLSRTLQSLDEGVLVLDGADRIRFTNERAKELLGEELSVGTPFKAEERLGSVISGGPSGTERYLAEHSGQELEVTTTPLSEEEGSVLVVRDVTTQSVYERYLDTLRQNAERVAEAKTQFLSIMSHELRTPLNSIIGMAELANGNADRGEQQEYLDILQRSAHQLLTIVNSILDFSKIEQGGLTLESRPFDPVQAATASISGLEVQAHNKSVGFYFDFRSRIPERLVGDEVRIAQIIRNLCGNAVKFTREGAVVLSVDYDGRFFSVKVSDTGPGIPEDRMEAIFEPFSQVDSSVTRRYGGTGIGLSLAKSLSEVMGGVIEVASVLGEGSAFTVKLPLEPAPPAAVSEEPADTGSCRTGPCLESLEIAVVSDSEQHREVLRVGLEELGASVVLSEPGDELGSFDGLVIESRLLPKLSNSEQLSGRTVVLARLTDADGVALPESAQVLAEPSPAFAIANALRGYRAANGRPAETEAAPHKPSGPAAPGRSAEPLQLLLVEDDRINQIANRRLLERLGHKVVVADDGEAAIEELRSSRFDAALLDIRLPGIDGIEVLRAIRSAKQPTIDPETPVIVLTALALEEDKKVAIEAGADAYLSKPFRPDDLAKTIDVAREGRGLGAAAAISDFLERAPDLISEDRFDELIENVRDLRPRVDREGLSGELLFRMMIAARKRDRVELRKRIEELSRLGEKSL